MNRDDAVPGGRHTHRGSSTEVGVGFRGTPVVWPAEIREGFREEMA